MEPKIVFLPGDAFLQITEPQLNWFDSGVLPVFPSDTRHKLQPYWMRGERHIADLMLSQRTFFDFEADLSSDRYDRFDLYHRPFELFASATCYGGKDEVNPYTKKPIQQNKKNTFADVMARVLKDIAEKVERHQRWHRRADLVWYIPEADHTQPLDKNEPLLLLAIRGELQWTQWNAFGGVRWSAYRKYGFAENLRRVVNESDVRLPDWLSSIGGYGSDAWIALTKHLGESK
jgi:hypothetical protein